MAQEIYLGTNGTSGYPCYQESVGLNPFSEKKKKITDKQIWKMQQMRK
jgi:hypothetical protein